MHSARCGGDVASGGRDGGDCGGGGVNSLLSPHCRRAVAAAQQRWPQLACGQSGLELAAAGGIYVNKSTWTSPKNLQCWPPFQLLRCPLLNALDRASIRPDMFASPGGERSGTLLLHAAPKGGSSSLREWTNTVTAAAKGPSSWPTGWNGNEARGPCALPAGLRGAWHPVPAVASALLVREPASRFFAAVHEVLLEHCSTWLHWRQAHNRTDPALESWARCRHELFLARVPGAGHCVAPSSDPSAFEAIVACPPDAAPPSWGALTLALLRDVAEGFNNVHFETTTQHAVLWAAPTLDRLVHLERPHEWTSFLTAAGLKPTLGLPAGRNSSSEGHTGYSRDAMTADFDDGAWTLLCKTYAVDFACLGYEQELPPQCAKPRASLNARV